MESANSDHEYGNALEYLDGRIEKIAVQVFVRPSCKLLLQVLYRLEQKSRRWIWKPKAWVDLDIAKLYHEFRNKRDAHLRELADVFIGAKPGQRVSFVGILWEQLDSEGNLEDVGRVRGGHEPKAAMPISETLRISRFLVKEASELYKGVEAKRLAEFAQ